MMVVSDDGFAEKDHFKCSSIAVLSLCKFLHGCPIADGVY